MENNEKTKGGFFGRVDDYFGITKLGSNFKTEIVAGIVTFLAMCYILTVNPNQFFYAGTANAQWVPVFMATAFGAVVGTLLMAFLAKLPLAQASGMGLNAMVGSIIGGGVGAFAYGASFSLANAMIMVFISGIIFLALSVITIKGKSLRQYIFEGIPTPIKLAIPAGIGLFIAFIGFQNAGVIIDNQFTLVDFANLQKISTCKPAIVCLIGLLTIAILSKLKIQGSVIIGILFATVIGIPFGVTNVDYILGTQDGVTWKFWENFGTYFGSNGVVAKCFTEGFSFPAGTSVMTVVMLILTFCMIDMFDTIGTSVGCCAEAGLLDENGTPVRYNRIMLSDSIATCAGAVLGTSTVTTFVESGSGIAAGGKTGFTALVTAALFLLSIFLMPVFAMIPSAAASSALIYVGVLMIKNIAKVDFTDPVIAIPAFLTIVIMPLGYSITKGIGIGIMTYVLISAIVYLINLIKYAITKEEKPVWNIPVITLVVAALFVVYFFVPTVL